jgi:hypothetical protein
MRKTSTSGAKGKKSRPKFKLGIPDLEHSKAAVLRSIGSASCRFIPGTDLTVMHRSRMLSLIFGVLHYSVLSACIGSTDAARRAGSRHAAVSTASNTQTAPAVNAGSYGLT